MFETNSNLTDAISSRTTYYPQDEFQETFLVGIILEWRMEQISVNLLNHYQSLNRYGNPVLDVGQDPSHEVLY